MRAEFFHSDQHEQVVAVARWDGARAAVEGANGASLDEELARSIRHAFRATPVVVDDPFLLPPGAKGPVLLEPGDARWFMEAARTRVGEGLEVRFVPDATRGMGWDPAGAYDTFRNVVEPGWPSPATAD
jgi:hypothetical protein